MPQSTKVLFRVLNAVGISCPTMIETMFSPGLEAPALSQYTIGELSGWYLVLGSVSVFICCGSLQYSHRIVAILILQYLLYMNGCHNVSALGVFQ